MDVKRYHQFYSDSLESHFEKQRDSQNTIEFCKLFVDLARRFGRGNVTRLTIYDSIARLVDKLVVSFDTIRSSINNQVSVSEILAGKQNTNGGQQPLENKLVNSQKNKKLFDSDQILIEQIYLRVLLIQTEKEFLNSAAKTTKLHANFCKKYLHELKVLMTQLKLNRFIADQDVEQPFRKLFGQLPPVCGWVIDYQVFLRKLIEQDLDLSEEFSKEIIQKMSKKGENYQQKNVKKPLTASTPIKVETSTSLTPIEQKLKPESIGPIKQQQPDTQQLITEVENHPLIPKVAEAMKQTVFPQLFKEYKEKPELYRPNYKASTYTKTTGHGIVETIIKKEVGSFDRTLYFSHCPRYVYKIKRDIYG